MTSVGRWTRSTTLAIVKVLPVPVAPSSVMWGSPAWMPSTSWSMAVRLVTGRDVVGVDLERGHA